MLRRSFLLMSVAACGAPSSELITLPGPPRFGDARPTDWPGMGPAAYPVHGIDVARFQPGLDWRAAQGAGVSFAFIKATEGGDMIDPMFADHWEGALKAGVPRGAYHFYYFCRPAQDQARWFIENVPRARGSLPPVLDLEWNPFSPTCTYRPPPATVRAEIRIFLDIVERHFGQRPIVYSTPDFFASNDIGSLGEELWLRATAQPPSQVYPGIAWRFWQYSATGRIPGVEGDVDLNAFSGSRSDWIAWLARRQVR